MNQFVKLNGNQFEEFFRLMQGFGAVHAPVQVSEQSYAYRKVESSKEIAFSALRTILPPKKYFFPQSETLVEFDGQTIKEKVPELLPMVLFGVHPCDLSGLAVLDQIFGADPKDTHYFRRKEKALIVGLSCMPDKYCFCPSVNADLPNKGYDLFVTALPDIYIIEIKTAKGHGLIEQAPELFHAIEENDHKKYNHFWLKRSEAFTASFDDANLSATMEMEWDNPLWDELGKRCLSCGNCVPVCPTCYCFDLVDIASLNGAEAERQREWDSCQLNGFAGVAGDFNFRPNPVDRLKFWYRHKLHGFDDPYGLKTCVGCGRCTVSCPAGIDDLVGVVKGLQISRESKNDTSEDKKPGTPL